LQTKWRSQSPHISLLESPAFLMITNIPPMPALLIFSTTYQKIAHSFESHEPA
jgi:hypothetical protein